MSEAAAGSPPRCLACGSDRSRPWAEARDLEYLTSTEAFRYLHCETCGVLFIHPCPVDRLAEIYPSNYYAYASTQRSLAHRAKDWLDARLFRRLLRQLHASELAVLDVGGGDGWLLSVIRRLDDRVRFTQVVDMDAGAEVLASGQGHAYHCGRIEDFRTERRFHLILLLNLVEHVADPGAVLGSLRELLTPDGLLLVKTPNHDTLDARLFREHNWGGLHCPRHWVLFDRESFEAIATRSGLAVESFRYTQGASFWANSVLMTLFHRGWIDVSRERPVMNHPLFAPLAAGFAAFDLARVALGTPTSQMFVTLRPA